VKGTKPQLRTDPDAISARKSAPSWMSVDAKAEWRRVFPSLIARKILTEADLGGLENYCVACGRVREVEKHLQANGIDPVFVRMQDKAMQTARQLAAELGLTPVSRSRPTVRDDDKDDSDENPLNIS
jgi:P27 family predicted phage terminase small subunit